MIIYVYPKCSTCQKALRFLEEKKMTITVKDIVKQPPHITELRQMLDYQQGHIKKLFNTTGKLYQTMQLAQELAKMSLSQALGLLNQHGMLVKRPFLLGDKFGLLGFKESEWAKQFK